ncbi:MAG: GAF domain-containing sensor histidine kinase [Anaerolineales bacterium]|nr:GAF domain-containing sensor histidine kinase [Anaerolineales bacterium]
MLLTREQLQERLIALHLASLELVKDVSLETLLESIASLACEQAGARYAALGVLDEQGKLRQFITVGMTAEEIKRIPHPPRGRGLIGALMRGGGTLRIPEIKDDPRSVGFPSSHAPMHSLLGVPIRVGDKQLGQIYLTEKKDFPEFTEDDEKVIEMLAVYAGVAIQNARLYESLRKHDQTLAQRNEDLALLNHIGSALASSLELEEILNKTLAQLMAHFKVEAGEIFLREDDGHTLRLVLHRGEAAEAFWTRNRFRIGEGIIGLVAETMQPAISHDLKKDKYFLREAVVQAGFKQMACIPLTARGELVGVLSLAARSQRPFEENEIQMLISVGAAAGTAIENARLHFNARRVAVLEERERIGMDLHDGVIQSIYGVGMALENARLLMREDIQQADNRIQKAMDDLNRTIRDIRTYILDLRPRDMRDDSLMEGLQRLIAEFQQNAKAEITLAGPKNDHLGDLPQLHAMALFHICQEALANVAKHAHATKVSVDLWVSSDRVLLEIHDDGRGFYVAEINKMVGHGLANMMTRVHNVSGDLDVTSTPGEGTTILAWVPRS